MGTPPKDPASGWQDPHQGLIQGGYPLHPPLYLGNRLPNGREVPIHCHPACEAEVQEGQYRDLPYRGRQGRGWHCRTDPSRHHALQSHCEGVESGVRLAEGCKARGWGRLYLITPSPPS